MILSRLQFIGLALVACLLSTAGGVWYGYEWGTDAEANRNTAAGVDRYVEGAKSTERLSVAIAAIGTKLRAAIADSTEHERASTVTVTRIIREHPEFAAVRRPAELQRVRRDQLERIAAAAEGD